MSINCKIVQDLLPLYHDGVCSEESRKLVEEHLSQCENCKRMLSEMDGEWVLSKEETNELKPLREIKKAVKKGKRKALFTGVAIAMTVVVLLFGAVNVWWYVGYYRFYQQFSEGHDPTMMHAYDSDNGQEKSWVLDANEFVWEDETYSYHVQVPDYLQRNGSVDIERLDNNYEGESISLSIGRGITGEYTYTVFIDKNGLEDGFEAFMLDPELNQEYLSHWDEEMIAEQEARFIEHWDEVMEIIVAAKEMWKFLK